MKKIILVSSGLCIGVSAIANAQLTVDQTTVGANSKKSAEQQNAYPNKRVEPEEIVVSAHPLSREGLSQAFSVLRGDELSEKVQGSLGATVAGEPGIRSASFGAAVGRPVIHGLGGPRVKTTEDRIDSLDVSVTSTDHAVTVEPFIANQITVLKGASTLLYGSNAIGGVVDVETGRIPKKRLNTPVQGRVELRAADNADATTAVARLDAEIATNWVAHVDVFSKDADDYDIPGFVESEALRASEVEEEGAEHGAEDEERDVLEGSFYDSQGGAVGLSYIGDRGFIGASISTIDAQYGLVGGHEEEGEEGEEEAELFEGEELEEAPGMIDLEQTRIDIEAQLDNPFSGFESINFRIGINDYEHQEIEGSGEVGSLFDNDAWEARVELRHSEFAGFEGAVGLQLNDREFSAVGEEAFVEPVDSSSEGVFWVGERSFENFDLEAGVRFESTEHTPVDQSQARRKFSTSSASIGLVKPISSNAKVAGLIDYSSRAPSIEELFSNGPHLATQSFEIGDVELEEESALGVSFTLNYESDLFDANVTLYHMDFDDFIFQADTGLVEDGLPVRQYRQANASFTGVDVEAGLHLISTAQGDFDVTMLFDLVEADVDVTDNQNLPRIPAARFGLGLAWANKSWSAKLNYQSIGSQNDTAAFELPTSSYNDLSLRINKRFDIGDSEVTAFLQGRNLSDDEQRQHTSFVKDFAPSPGRTIEVGVRLVF